MFCTKIDIFRCQKYPLLLGAIYEKIAEHPRLPDLRLIQRSAKEEVRWPDRSYNRLEVYYLDNLVEANRRDIFQLRFSTAPNSRELTSLFLSTASTFLESPRFSHGEERKQPAGWVFSFPAFKLNFP